MIEDVESFQPEFKRFGFSHAQNFRERHVKILDAWSIKESTGYISQLPKVLRTEWRSIERSLPISRVGVDLKRPAIVLGRVQQIIIDAVPQRSQQRIV